MAASILKNGTKTLEEYLSYHIMTKLAVECSKDKPDHGWLVGVD
jgi:hypothetical protein